MTSAANLKRGPMPEWYQKKKMQKRELMIDNCKKTWEQARVGHLSDKDRKPLISSLMNQITGHIVEVVFKHDASRMVQCCIKYGTPSDIQIIYDELKPRMLDLIKSTYGKYIVLALLNHCKALRVDILELCSGRVEELLKNKDSGYLIEVVYHTYASPKQKKAMVSELYCVQVKKSAQYTGMPLDKIIESSPALKDIIKTHMKKLLFALVQKGGLGDMTIILRALWEYLAIFDDVDFIDVLQEQVIEFLHHKDGMRISNYVIRKSTAKQRKTILKAFKPHIKKVYLEEYGHLVLITAFSCVDDTKMMHKYLMADMMMCLDDLDLVNCKFSRRVVSYLLTQSTHLIPNNYSQMLKDDSKYSAETSKKDEIVRFEELKEMCKSDLLPYIIKNMETLVTCPGVELIESLFKFGDDSSVEELLKSLADVASSCLLNQHFCKLISRLLKSDAKDKILNLICPIVEQDLVNLVESDAKLMIASLMRESPGLRLKIVDMNLESPFWTKTLLK